MLLFCSKDILDSEDDDEEQETADIPEVVIPEVSKEKFYEMSSSLRDTFVGKAKGETEQSGSFSLLAAFGRSNQNQDNEKKEMEYEGKTTTSRFLYLHKWVMKKQ